MTRTHSPRDVADALGVDAGDVLTVLRALSDGREPVELSDDMVDEIHDVLDGPDGARSVPEGFLPPDFKLGDEWRSLGPGGPADDDPRVV